MYGIALSLFFKYFQVFKISLTFLTGLRLAYTMMTSSQLIHSLKISTNGHSKRRTPFVFTKYLIQFIHTGSIFYIRKSRYS